MLLSFFIGPQVGNIVAPFVDRAISAVLDMSLLNMAFDLEWYVGVCVMLGGKGAAGGSAGLANVVCAARVATGCAGQARAGLRQLGLQGLQICLHWPQHRKSIRGYAPDQSLPTSQI